MSVIESLSTSRLIPALLPPGVCKSFSTIEYNKVSLYAKLILDVSPIVKICPKIEFEKSKKKIKFVEIFIGIILVKISNKVNLFS